MTGEQRKKSIAETTVKIVAEYGVRGATTARIAAAEGISEKALYKQYAGRREILVAALDAVLERAESVLRGHQSANALDYLRAAARLHCPSRSDFLYPLYEFLASSPQEDLRRELKLRHVADIEFLITVIEDGKAQGLIRPEVDSELAAWDFWAVCWAEDNAYIMGFDDYGPSGLSDRMIERFIQSISAQTPSLG
jgi:AcrR family transcriptional regulator